MAPHLPSVAAVTLTVVQVLACMIHSAAPRAPLAGLALSVVMILHGQSIIPSTNKQTLHLLGWQRAMIVGDKAGANVADH